MTGIYKITNMINGKSYIGQSRNIFRRWSEHFRIAYGKNDKKCIIHNAILKYGIINFKFEILDICSNEDLSDSEIYFIKLYKTNINGYNITEGGETSHSIGSINGNAKLSEEDVLSIRKDYLNMETKQNTFKKYSDKISFNTFHDIWIGKTWTHILMEVYTEENKERQKKNIDKIKTSKNLSKTTPEQVLDIRNLKNSGLQRKVVYEKYSFLNLNTFNDIWYNHTFKHIDSDVKMKYKKHNRDVNQNGIRNPSAKFTIEDIDNIIKRKKNGENLKDVYVDFKKVTFPCFSNLWNGKTYREEIKKYEFN